MRLLPSVAALASSNVGQKTVARATGTALAQKQKPAAEVVGTGNLPAGFGQQVTWTGEDDLAIVAFINTADDYGLCVSGVRDGDTYQLVSAAGSATFDVDTKNNGLAGLISVVGVGADIAATAFGLPEIVPLIKAASDYAQKQFPESEEHTKRRDVWGVDDDDHKARQEGGVIVCEPRAQGIYRSGSEDHKDHWIQHDGTRVDGNCPKHIPVHQAFFLRQGMDPRRLHGDGDLFLSAWDYSFADNTGAYEVHLILRRGNDQDTTTPVG